MVDGIIYTGSLKKIISPSPAKKALQLISTEWHKHVDKGDSLMFKWLKSPRTSSKIKRTSFNNKKIFTIII